MDCSLPRSSVHGILQARILELVAISFSKGFSRPRDQTRISRIVGRHFTVWATREVLHYRVLECKSRKSRDTWSNSKFGHGVQNETGQRLTEFCQENTLVITNTHFQVVQETTLHMDIATWSVLKSDCLYSLQLKMEKLYTVSKTRPGAYCGSDHQLLLKNSGSNWRK